MTTIAGISQELGIESAITTLPFAPLASDSATYTLIRGGGITESSRRRLLWNLRAWSPPCFWDYCSTF